MAIEPKITARNLVLVLKRVKAVDDAVLERGAKGMRLGLVAAVATIQTGFLQGPRPEKLDIITQRLRQSITSRVDVQPGRGAIGRVGTNVKYAPFHEFGFRGSVNVAGHSRGEKFFKAHARQVNYAGRPFVRPGVKKALPVVLREIKRELKDL